MKDNEGRAQSQQTELHNNMHTGESSKRQEVNIFWRIYYWLSSERKVSTVSIFLSYFGGRNIYKGEISLLKLSTVATAVTVVWLGSRLKLFTHCRAT